MTTYRIFFVDLFALVPNIDKSSATLLFPKAKGRKFESKGHKVKIVDHYPVVFFSHSQVTRKQHMQAKLFADKLKLPKLIPENPRIGACRAEGREFHIGGAPGLQWKGDIDSSSGGCPTSHQDVGQIKWLARQEDCSPKASGGGNIDENVLTKADSRVATRIKVTEGLLSVATLSEYCRDGKPCLIKAKYESVTSRGGRSSNSYCIAEALMLEIEQESPLTIRVKEMNGKSAPSLVIPAESAIMDVIFAHSPPVMKVKKHKAFHFACLYDFCKQHHDDDEKWVPDPDGCAPTYVNQGINSILMTFIYPELTRRPRPAKCTEDRGSEGDRSPENEPICGCSCFNPSGKA